MIRILTVTFIHFLACRLGLFFLHQTAEVSVFWPANAISVLSLFIVPRPQRRWALLGIWLMDLIANRMVGNSLAISLSFAVVNTLEIGLVSRGLDRWVLSDITLLPLKQFYRLVLILISVCAGSALGLGAIASFGFGTSFWQGYLGSFTGDFVPYLIMLPLGLCLMSYEVSALRAWSSTRTLEYAVVVACTIALSIVIRVPIGASVPLYLLFLPLVWSALRFERFGGSSMTFLSAIILIWRTGQGWGPFVALNSSLDWELTSLQLSLMIFSAVTLLVAAYVLELKLIQERLLASNSELERFAHAASHDLKEPLRTMHLYSQLLEQEMGTPSVTIQKYLNGITNSAARMQQLLSGILDYSATHYDLNLEPVPLNEVISEVLDSMKASIQEAGAEIQIGSLPIVRGDRKQLFRLFLNLLENSLKFRGSQKPIISISATARPRSVVIQVKDNGTGFDPAYAQKVFALFTRLHSQEIIGPGIGLSTCKSIVEKHGGKIWATSVPGEGTSIFSELPVLKVSLGK